MKRYNLFFNGSGKVDELMDPIYTCDWCKNGVTTLRMIPITFMKVVYKEVYHKVCDSCYRNHQISKLGIEDE